MIYNYNKRPTFYYNNNKDHPIRAGGVLFYYKGKGEAQLLMIKNHISNKYEDFGGKTDSQDKTIYDTIAREVEEESNNIFDKDHIINKIKQNHHAHFCFGKYLLYLVELDEYVDPTKFGDLEIHDNLPRTVEWIPISDILSKKFRNGCLHLRLRHKVFYDTLQQNICYFG